MYGWIRAFSSIISFKFKSLHRSVPSHYDAWEISRWKHCHTGLILRLIYPPPFTLYCRKWKKSYLPKPLDIKSFVPNWDIHLLKNHDTYFSPNYTSKWNLYRILVRPLDLKTFVSRVERHTQSPTQHAFRLLLINGYISLFIKNPDNVWHFCPCRKTDKALGLFGSMSIIHARLY